MDALALIQLGASDALADKLLRLAVFAAGALAALHFACMACVVHGPRVPWLDALLIAGCAGSGFGAALCAAIACTAHVLILTALLAWMLMLFLLRLWWRGFYVSVFLKERPCD